MNSFVVVVVLCCVAASQATRFNTNALANDILCESTPKPIAPLVEYPLAMTQLEAAELGLAPFPYRDYPMCESAIVPITYTDDEYKYAAAPLAALLGPYAGFHGRFN